MYAYSEATIVDMVKVLKDYRNHWYDLPIDKFTEFMKIKSNLIKDGVFVTDEMLDLPEDQLIALLKKQLQIDTKNNNVAEDSKVLSKLMSVDIQGLNEDRMRIRKSLFGTNITLFLNRSGKSFNVNMSSNMQTVKVTIPVTWEINLPQALLLSLYDKTFKDTLPHIDPNDIQSIVSVLSNRYNDYAVLRKLIALDYYVNRQNEHIIEDELGRQLEKLGLTGLSLITVYLIINMYKLRRINRKALFEILGRRKRLAAVVFNYI